jgi:hypothetical protein
MSDGGLALFRNGEKTWNLGAEVMECPGRTILIAFGVFASFAITAARANVFLKS